MKTIVAISLFLISSLAYSQDRYRFQHFSTEDGLAHIAVNTISQDSYGYLWFGTWNGLSRFDGYSFRNYAFDPNDPQALTHGTIYDIKESQSGELWVSTEAGLDHFVREQDRFQPHLGDCGEKKLCGTRFNVIEFDQQDRLWTSSWHYRHEGMQYWDVDAAGFEIGLPIRTREILNMGRYWWLPKNKGIIMLEPETNEVYPAPEILPVLERVWDVAVYKMAKGLGGDIWLATQEGIFVLKNGKLSKRPGWPTSNITSLLVDSHGGVWMGTSKGLYHQPEGSSDIHLIQHDPAFSLSLSSNEINCLYEDRQGNIWIGTERGGLNKIQLSPSNWFQALDTHDFGVMKNSLTVYAILKTRDQKQIWAGTNLGVFIFDANSHQLIHHLEEELPQSQIRAIYEDSNGNIWVGSWGHTIIRFSKAGRSTYLFEAMPPGGGSVRRIVEDLQGGLWTGSRQLIKVENKKEVQRVFSRLPHKNLQTSTPYIWDFQFIDSCHVWIACNQGIYYHDVCQDSSKDAHFFQAQGHKESMAVFDVYIGKKDILWAGLWGGGLAKYDLKSKRIRRYGRIHGLPGNHVYGILEDGQNQLWLSTDHGIARFNPRTEQFYKFTVIDGLMANEFDSGAFFEAEDGEMFFGGRNGLVRFRPWEIPANPNNQQLDIRLTDFSISGDGYHRKTALEALDSIEFTYDRNQVLEFSFSAFDYAHLGETRYKYRLLGFDDEWSAPTLIPRTRYTDLSPGEYSLEIMASNSEGFSSQNVKTISLRIHPLLIQRTWFKAIAVATAIFLLSLLVYIRTRRLNRRERTLLQYKAALAKQEALAAQFDHHFTFNSLNSIQRFVIEKENKQAIRYISRFGKLIRRVMHQARQNLITIEEELQTLELYLSLEQLRVRHPFIYDIRIDKHIDPFTAEIPTMLIQPYLENAIWHGLMPAERPGHIMMTFEQKGTFIHINITDDGIGRKKSAELKAKSRMQHESRGMTLARERLESLHLKGGNKGTLKIHDLYDKKDNALGTRIELKIPILT